MDKTSFLDALRKEGYNAGFYNNGIPTVFINDSALFGSIDRNINQLRKDLGYDQSYGISLIRSTPQMAASA